VARRGYRFVAPATEWQEERPAPHVQPAIAANPLPEPSSFPAVVPRRRLIGWLAAAAVALVAGGWLLGTWSATRQRPAPAGGSLLLFAQQSPPGSALTSGGALSPNATSIAFTAEELDSGLTYLWVRGLDSASTRKLEGTAGAQRPFWSPDSRFLGFIADGRLKTVAASGGTPTDLAPVGPRASGAAWSTSGQIIFSTWLSSFPTISASGGNVRKLSTLKAGELAHAWPQFLPDGDHYLYSVYGGEGGIWVGSVSTGQQRHLLSADPGAVYSPRGYLVFTRRGILSAQAFDPASLTLRGDPFTVIDGNVTFPSMTNGTLLSAAGDLLAVGGAQGESELVWFDRRGQRLSTLSTTAPLHNPALSPDGTRVFGNTFPPSQSGIWMVDLERGATSRVIPDGTMPVPAPDGRTLAYTATLPNGAGILTASIDAPDAGDRAAHAVSVDAKIPVQFADDGRTLLYYTFSDRGQNLAWLTLPDGTSSSAAMGRSTGSQMQGRLSPDGRWLAYAGDESGRWEVYVQSFPQPTSRLAISTNGGSEPYWRGDGRELYYVAADRSLMAVDIAPGPRLRVGRPHVLFRPRVVGEPATYRSHYVASPDGQRFLIDVLRDPALDSVSVLLNWTAR
jgi:Tol biopolymer transport system component